MRTFILGTDWGEDCDDCVAVRILARAHKKGEINLAGIGINTLVDASAPSLYRFLEKEGYVCPIGVDKNCPHQIRYVTYQKRLAAETDKVETAIVLITISTAINTLRHFLRLLI